MPIKKETMILLTGATGLLGSHLLYELLKKGKEVTAIRRSERNIPEVIKIFKYYTKEPSELLDKVSWITADMLNYHDILEVMEGIDEVYHCAAIVSFDTAKRGSMIRSNRVGTANLVNAALECKVRKFIHVSSTAAIGKSYNDAPANETMIWSEAQSTTGYSISKFHSEMEVWRGIQEGLNAAIINPSIILGPGFWQTGSSLIVSKVDHGMKFYSYGMTGYVGVWDVVKAMMNLMESSITGERFLVTSENLSYKDIFDKLADQLNKPKPTIEGTVFIAELAWRLDWVKSKIFGIGKHTFSKEGVRTAKNVTTFDNSKIKIALDFEFEPIDDVVKKVVHYYNESELK
ncbi:NAD-dependent epimerase/dehydratase family protein [Bacteroidota bacterium]